MDVSGLRCIVTGAASGIGEQVARELTERGGTVVSLDRREPSAPVADHLDVDLAEKSSIDAVVTRLGANWDALINVAGIPGTAPDEAVFRVNFLGLRHLTESMLPHLNTGGSVVNVSSTAGLEWAARLELITELLATKTFDDGLRWFTANRPDVSAYNFSKEAVTVYTHANGGRVSREFGLRMNAVLPGVVDTPILADFERSMGKEILDGVKEFVGRHAKPGDVAPAAVFLASRDAGWINGSAVTVDGGITGAVMTGVVPMPDR
ncbi:coniferyl-alcohol dehydrogenase [Mycolicibacterium palauense]|uniref:coniferyl-alcohol dehydrogenase n=1 Tax=Mycolicibacterium palauense TaxID=2034511 RepID=UPI000BFEC729|nr:coniferyl-alcohol dehydrogenase [Mycolicibacterium palauense]